jgi:hypothetical protein
MDPAQIANLIALGIQAGTQAYAAIRAAHSDVVPPLEDVLAQADANYDQIIANANAQLKPPTT